MEKHLVTSEEDFNAWISDLGFRLNCDVTSCQKYPPNYYPCVVVYTEINYDSMRWHCLLRAEYVYMHDLEGADSPDMVV